jgi:hypothetical protein
MNTIKTSLAISLTALGIGACGSATLPTQQLASTEASVRAAQELGAQNVPRAELHLRLAKEEVDRAHKLADDGDQDKATMQLDRARADAELAVALTRQAQAESDLAQVSKNDVANPSPTNIANAH